MPNFNGGARKTESVREAAAYANARVVVQKIEENAAKSVNWWFNSGIAIADLVRRISGAWCATGGVIFPHHAYCFTACD